MELILLNVVVYSILFGVMYVLIANFNARMHFIRMIRRMKEALDYATESLSELSHKMREFNRQIEEFGRSVGSYADEVRKIKASDHGLQGQ